MVHGVDPQLLDWDVPLRTERRLALEKVLWVANKKGLLLLTLVAWCVCVGTCCGAPW